MLSLSLLPRQSESELRSLCESGSGHFSDMAAMADDVGCREYSGSRRSTRFHHRGVARFPGRKSENISNVDDDCQ
jgi:hypothetical protein